MDIEWWMCLSASQPAMVRHVRVYVNLRQSHLKIESLTHSLAHTHAHKKQQITSISAFNGVFINSKNKTKKIWKSEMKAKASHAQLLTNCRQFWMCTFEAEKNKLMKF